MKFIKDWSAMDLCKLRAALNVQAVFNRMLMIELSNTYNQAEEEGEDGECQNIGYEMDMAEGRDQAYQEVGEVLASLTRDEQHLLCELPFAEDLED